MHSPHAAGAHGHKHKTATPDRPSHPYIEIVAAAILSAAALLTSWSGYQASLWEADQASAFANADALRANSVRASTKAGQVMGLDIMMFSQWLSAYAHGDDQLKAFYEERFRPGFKDAFNDWLATKPEQTLDAPATPFLLPDYKVAALADAHKLEDQANAAYNQGVKARHIGDDYTRATVVLAAAMFFGGICQAFHLPKVRWVLIVISAMTCVAGAIAALALPIHGAP
jgi:hypothetical protein